MMVMKCDVCKKLIGKNVPHWEVSKELINSPDNMEDMSEFDEFFHKCIKCVPLGEYKQIEEEVNWNKK